METINVTIAIPKESKEMADFLGKIIQHFVQKKSLAQISAILPEGIKAFDGFDKIDDEFKEDHPAVTSYTSLQIMRSLKKPKSIPAT